MLDPTAPKRGHESDASTSCYFSHPHPSPHPLVAHLHPHRLCRRPAEAVELFRDVLRIRHMTQGAAHPDTLEATRALSAAQRASGGVSVQGGPGVPGEGSL